MNKMFRNTAFYLIVILVVVGIVQWVASQGKPMTEIPYSEFRKYLNDNQIQMLRMRQDSGTLYIEGQLKSAANKEEMFITRAPLFTEEIFNLIDEKIDKNHLVVYNDKAKEGSLWISFFTSIIPLHQFT